MVMRPAGKEARAVQGSSYSCLYASLRWRTFESFGNVQQHICVISCHGLSKFKSAAAGKEKRLAGSLNHVIHSFGSEYLYFPLIEFFYSERRSRRLEHDLELEAEIVSTAERLQEMNSATGTAPRCAAWPHLRLSSL